MTTLLSRDIGDQLGRIGRHWGWLVFFGILMVAAGICAVAWPGPTVVVLAVLFGIQIIVSGIFSFINAFAADESGGMRVWNVILGLLGIVIGLYAVRHIIVSVVALALLVGIYWVAYGIAQIYAAIAHRELPHRGWMGFHRRAECGRRDHRDRMAGPVAGHPGPRARRLADHLRHHGDHAGVPRSVGHQPRAARGHQPRLTCPAALGVDRPGSRHRISGTGRPGLTQAAMSVPRRACHECRGVKRQLSRPRPVMQVITTKLWQATVPGAALGQQHAGRPPARVVHA
jgi:uncharacterized membrane protein HdeD (DUF308 family)